MKRRHPLNECDGAGKAALMLNGEMWRRCGYVKHHRTSCTITTTWDGWDDVTVAGARHGMDEGTSWVGLGQDTLRHGMRWQVSRGRRCMSWWGQGWWSASKCG